MKNSNLYRIHLDKKILQSVKEIDFADFKVKERYDIQEWVESNPEILGEELMIISKELSYFDNTRERPDLIAIDKEANIVIIELKRDDSGTGLEWQAIKYASYLSKFKAEEIVHVFAEYLQKYQPIENITEDEVTQKILDFIEEDNLSDLNKNQRLILVSHRFAREVTSAVNWLIDKHDMDIKVVQLIPFFDQDRDTYYLQSNTILPLPGEEDLIIKALGRVEKRKVDSFGPTRKADEITSFFEDIKTILYDTIERKLTPDKTSRWAGVGGNFRYFHFWYDDKLWENWGLSYRVWVYDDTYNQKEWRGKIGVFIECNTKYLFKNGITEKVMQEILVFLKSLAGPEFKLIESKNSIVLEKLLSNDRLSNNLKSQVASDLQKLISLTKEKIDVFLT
jgi:hypothetical protein